MKITQEWLESNVNMGALNHDQATLLKLPWPLKSGWKNVVIGQELSESDAEMFSRLKGLRPKARKREIEGARTLDILAAATMREKGI